MTGLGVALTLVATQAVTEVYDVLSPELLQAHVEYLAGDALLGRGTAQHGGELAAGYIAAQFRRLRLQPGGDAGGYLQAVPLDLQVGDDGSALEYRQGPLTVRFEPGPAWRLGGACPQAGILEGSLAYVGYGISAPGLGHDDYAGIDVRGKVVLALWGAPRKLVRRPDAVWLGHPAHKAAAAKARGASAFLLVVPAPAYDVLAAVPWAAPPPGLPSGWGDPDAILSDSVARALLEASEIDSDSLFAATAAGEPRTMEVGGAVTLSKRPRFERVRAWNVVGVIPGTDPARQREAVVFTAHYDAIGVRREAGIDSVFNGAVESATGAARLLALAEGLSAFPGGRTIVLAATGAGTLGRLGTWHYVGDPPWPLSATVAAVSLDGGLDLLAVPRAVAARGAQLSTLGEVAERAARIAALRLEGGRQPEDLWALGAGHFPFLLSAVPAIAASSALDFQGRGEGWGEETWNRYFAERARRPGDEIGPDLDYRGPVALAHWAYVVARILADGEIVPAWSREAPFADAPARRPPACLAP